MSEPPDKAPGISLRFIRQFHLEQDLNGGTSLQDIAWELAANDTRVDVSFWEKYKDALTFVRSRIH